MRRRDTTFPHNCLLFLRHVFDVTQLVQQLPKPATLPWSEITDIWLIRLVVALAAILEHEFCSRSYLQLKKAKNTCRSRLLRTFPPRRRSTNVILRIPAKKKVLYLSCDKNTGSCICLRLDLYMSHGLVMPLCVLSKNCNGPGVVLLPVATNVMSYHRWHQCNAQRLVKHRCRQCNDPDGCQPPLSLL